MIYNQPNVIGGGDIWASNPDGTTQIVELDANDTTVVFTNVPKMDYYGYMPWVNAETMTDPTVDPPMCKPVPTFSTPVDGLCTVTFTLKSAVTANQAGAKVLLRIVR